jgi:hypothetical protein
MNPTIEKVAWADRHRPGSRLPPLSAAAYPVAGARKTMDVLVRTSWWQRTVCPGSPNSSTVPEDQRTSEVRVQKLQIKRTRNLWHALLSRRRSSMLAPILCRWKKWASLRGKPAWLDPKRSGIIGRIMRTLHTLLSLWWWIKAPKYRYLASKPWERSHKVFIFFLTDKGDDANDTVFAPSIGQSPCIRPSCCCTNLDEAKALCMCANYWCGPSSHQTVPRALKV